MQTIKRLFQQPFCRYSLLACFLLLGVQGVFLALKWQNLPPRVPLFYSLPWGDQQLAQKPYLFLLPGATLAALVINIVLAILFLDREVLLSQILLWSSCLLALIATIGLVHIVLLIT